VLESVVSEQQLLAGIGRLRAAIFECCAESVVGKQRLIGIKKASSRSNRLILIFFFGAGTQGFKKFWRRNSVFLEFFLED
jgi:hypothetical protein